jgi:hypothetical protein
MGRRDLLTDDERRELFGLPDKEPELIRHCTLSATDLKLVLARHGATNRIGLAIELCLLRYPGFGFRSGERIPVSMILYVARQVAVPPAN